MKRWQLLCVFAVCGACGDARADVRLVDDDALLGGDGLSWATAYRHLQDALADGAGDPGITEIRVAQGNYRPDQDEGGNVTLGDRSSTFQLLNGVSIQGGYAGIGAPDPDERDVNLNLTVLNGDVLGNDLPTTNVFDPLLVDNMFHVVTANDVGNSAVLDGVTVRAGVAGIDAPLGERRGGGMLSVNGSPTICSTTFTANLAFGEGGAMYFIVNISPTLTDCVVSGNTGSAGGGIYFANQGSLVLDGCTIEDNNGGGNDGGGLYMVGGQLTATDCTFTGNEITANRGGGFYAAGVSGTMVNCVFDGNSAPQGAGMYTFGVGSSLELSGCTFTNNTGNDGAGLYADVAPSGQATLIQCSFQSNSASANGGAIHHGNGGLTLSGCSFEGNTGLRGGAVYDDENATYQDCSFVGNDATLAGGAAYVTVSSVFVGCTFTENTVNATGGAVHMTVGEPAFVNCRFFSNSAGTWGGAVRAATNGLPSFVNCTFAGNTAVTQGGAAQFGSATPTFVNCTLSGNSSQDEGGGIYSTQFSTTTLANCILWDNSDSTGRGESAQLDRSPDSSYVVDYSCIEGLTGLLGGSGNIGTDPAFVDPDGPDDDPDTPDDNDYRLTAASPCIDAADNTAVPPDDADLDDDGDLIEATPLDLDGNLRFHDDPGTADTGVPGNGHDDVVDMGVYEFGSGPPCVWDCANGDGEIGIEEFLAVLGSWGQTGVPCDFDGGGVGITDFLKVLGLWGPCP